MEKSKEELRAEKYTSFVWFILEIIVLSLSCYLFKWFVGDIDMKTLILGMFLHFVNTFFRAGRKNLK